MPLECSSYDSKPDEVPLECSSYDSKPNSSSDFQFFEVETFPRVYYFMVKSQTELFMWLRSFSHVLTGDTRDISVTSTILPSNAPLLSQSINIDDMYFARPKDWRMKKRNVFNFRRIYFRPPATTISPLQVTEVALQLVFELVEFARSANQEEYSTGTSANSGSSSSSSSSAGIKATDSKTMKMWEKETALSKWIGFLDQVISVFFCYQIDGLLYSYE